MSNVIDERYARRLQLVEEHVRLENAHDLTGILNTFGKEAAYEDAPWNDLSRGSGRGSRLLRLASRRRP